MTAALRRSKHPPRRRDSCRRDPQRSQPAQRGIRTGDILGNPRTRLHGRAVRIARADPARRGLHGQRRRLTVAKWPLLTEVRDANNDEVRVDPVQAFLVQAQLPAVGHARRQVLHQNVGARDQLVGLGVVALTREINRDTTLSGVEVLEEPAAFLVPFDAGKGSPAAERIT